MGNILGLEAPVTAKETERGEANGFKYAVSSMQGWRVKMEDAHSLVGSLPIPGLEDVALFGVYDGHGGDLTSKYAGAHFVDIFASQKEVKEYAELSNKKSPDLHDVPGVKLLQTALTKAFFEIDDKVKEVKLSSHRSDRSGSTIVVVLITPKHFICANAGDSRACFRRDGVAKPLSFDHKPNDPVELNRITSAGGFVRMKRVDGDLAVSRAIGDFQYKNRVNLPPELQKVTALPDILVYPRDMNKDEFVVVACDGIWDVVTNQECVTIIQKIFDEGETDIGSTCEELLDIGLEKRSRDNMTMLIVSLPKCRFSTTGGSGGVSARRLARTLNVSALAKSGASGS
jgi:serine/threonine protein phosphatase PrpC